jgi:hypothetical protein
MRRIGCSVAMSLDGVAGREIWRLAAALLAQPDPAGAIFLGQVAAREEPGL